MIKGLGLTESGFTTVRTFANTTTEAAAEPPLDASFVTVAQSGAVEFTLTSIVPGNNAGVTPNYVRFRYWARVNAAPAKTWKFYEETIPTSQLTLAAASNAIFPRCFNIQCDQVFVTVTFIDGTNPWITSGSIEARPLALQAKDDRTYKIDLASGNPITQDISYDALLQALKTARINDLYPAQNDPLVVSEASRATGDHYAPSADGIEMGTGYKRLTISYAFAAAGTSSVVNEVEATIDGTTWRTVTLSCIDAETGLSPTATSLDSTAGTAISKAVMVRHADHFKKFRLKSTVTSGPTGAHTVSFRRASDKS
jgi:hypothetical protein